MKKSVSMALLMMLLLAVPQASQATVFYNPETNHWYELVDATPTQAYWEAAGHTDGAIHSRIWSLAQQRAMANGGNLVTINDAAENQWLVETFQILVTTYDNGGAIQRSGVYIGLYQTDTTSEPAGGWTWISGSAGSYRNWLQEEPNDGGEQGTVAENWGAMYLALGWERNGYWLDVPEPFGKFDYGEWRYGIAEYETNPYAVPVPPAVWLLGTGLLGMLVIRRRFRK